MKNKMIIVGGGGHAKVVIDAAKLSGAYDICGIVDPKLPEGASVLGVKAVGGDEKLTQLFGKGIKYAFIGIGSVGECNVRKIIYGKLMKIGFCLPTVKHPDAVVSDDVELGEGTFIAAGVVINPGTKIGKNAIINTSSSIDHDCIIGDFVHIAPGVTLSGGVKVGDETHIGVGATIIQDINIGRGRIVKAGSTVVRDNNGKE